MNKTSLSYVEFDEAANLLREGLVCGFPTDTVFGLGARADSHRAVSDLFGIKQRSTLKPVIILCADLDMVRTLVEFSEIAEKLAKFWPGAMTLVLPQLPGTKLASNVNAGLKNLGVRIPNSPIIQKLINEVGAPIATSSANISGQNTGLNARSMGYGLPRDTPVLATRFVPAGVESTIVQVHQNKAILLRPGALSSKEILQKTGIKLA